MAVTLQLVNYVKVTGNYCYRRALHQNVARFHSSRRNLVAQIIDGRAIAQTIKDEVKAQVEKIVSSAGRRPHLCVILVGDDPASAVYVKNKIESANYTGISSDNIKLPNNSTQKEVVDIIKALNTNADVDGILVQLPIAGHMDERTICNTVVPHKDVDGFHVLNAGRFMVDQKAFMPATPAGVMEIIRRVGIKTRGQNAVVCGRSKNVGLPIAMLLHADGNHDSNAGGDATTTICHRNTPHDQLRRLTETADLIVSATGVRNLITGDMVKEGVAVIDVGITRIVDPKSGKARLVGDVDFESVAEKASFITPVPGGVGPVTVAMLLQNTLKAYKREIDFYV
ncbi:hypothetical protein ScPMuIL_005023 [Solemya velum]